MQGTFCIASTIASTLDRLATTKAIAVGITSIMGYSFILNARPCLDTIEIGIKVETSNTLFLFD